VNDQPVSDRPVNDLHWLTASEAARAFAAKTLSPVELMTALLQRIDQLDHRVNAFIRLDGDAAMTMARNAEAEIHAGRSRGPLHGVPVGIKDIICPPMNSPSVAPASICRFPPRATPGTPTTIPAVLPPAPAPGLRPVSFRWHSAPTPAAPCAIPPAPTASSV